MAVTGKVNWEKVGLVLGGVGVGIAVSWAAASFVPAEKEKEKDEKEKEQESVQAVVSGLQGGFLCNVLVVGVKLNLFEGLWNCQRKRGGGVTSAELAEWCGVNERLLREWLGCTASARVVQYEVDDDTKEVRYSIPQATVELVCAYGEGSPGGPQSVRGALLTHITLSQRLRRLAEAFHTGLGLTYDEGDEGGELAEGIRSLHAHVFRDLIPHELLPAFDTHCPSYGGVVAALEAGARVADVGCGAGGLALALAAAFPKSSFTGFDISECALADAREAQAKSGLSNIRFIDATTEPMGEGSHAAAYDLIVSYDLVHDCASPEQVISQIARGLTATGAWLVCDVVSGENHIDNLTKTDTVTWSFSVQLCLPSGMGSDGKGLALGTVGLSDAVADSLFKANGFREVIPFRHPKIPNSCFIALPNHNNNNK